MGFFAIAIAAGLAWAIWSKKLSMAQLPPIILGLVGLYLSLRGAWVIGLGAIGVGIAWYRGLTWRLFGLKTKQTDQYDLDKARFLLGVSAYDDEDRIRARHRILISEHHPDRGGSENRAQELNKARDLLLEQLKDSA